MCNCNHKQAMSTVHAHTCTPMHVHPCPHMYTHAHVHPCAHKRPLDLVVSDALVLLKTLTLLSLELCDFRELLLSHFHVIHWFLHRAYQLGVCLAQQVAKAVTNKVHSCTLAFIGRHAWPHIKQDWSYVEITKLSYSTAMSHE